LEAGTPAAKVKWGEGKQRTVLEVGYMQGGEKSNQGGVRCGGSNKIKRYVLVRGALRGSGLFGKGRAYNNPAESGKDWARKSCNARLGLWEEGH